MNFKVIRFNSEEFNRVLSSKRVQCLMACRSENPGLTSESMSVDEFQFNCFIEPEHVLAVRYDVDMVGTNELWLFNNKTKTVKWMAEHLGVSVENT